MKLDFGEHDSNDPLVYFAIFFGSTAYALLFAIIMLRPFLSKTNDFSSFSFALPVISALLSMLALRLAVNPLRRKKVRVAGYAGSTVAILAGFIVLLLFPAAHPVCFFGTVLLYSGLIANMVPWCTYLSTLNHRQLIYFTSGGSLFVGFSICLSSSFGSQYLLALVAILTIVALLCSLFLESNFSIQASFVSSTDSQKRNPDPRMKKNGAPLMCGGGAWGISIGLFLWLDDPLMAILLFGVSISVASLITFFFRLSKEYALESFMLRNGTFLTCLGIAVIPFAVQESFLELCLFYLLFTSTIHLFIILGALEETARFNELSSVWLFSVQGGIVLIGFTLFSLSFFVLQMIGHTFVGVTALSMGSILFFILFASLNKFGAYPTLLQDDNGDAKVMLTEESPSTKLDKIFWYQVFDEVTKERDLTPRQREVMELLAKGRDTRYIEEAFVVSRATAKTHIANLYQKIEVHSKRELIDYLEEKRGKMLDQHAG